MCIRRRENVVKGTAVDLFPYKKEPRNFLHLDAAATR